MKNTVFYFLIALLFSCGNGKKEEVVQFDDLTPSSRRYPNGKDRAETQITSKETPVKESFIARLSDTLSEGSVRWMKWDTLLFPDRFNPIGAQKWIAVSEKDSMVFVEYQFKDSLKVKNAFYNWLDCFGIACTSYVIGSNMRVRGRNALLLASEKQLIQITANNKLNESKIRSVFFSDPKKENWLYWVNIPRVGKTTWKKIISGKETPLIQGNENS